MRHRQQDLVKGRVYRLDLAPLLSQRHCYERLQGRFLGYKWSTLRDLGGRPFAVSCWAWFKDGEAIRSLRLDGGKLWRATLQPDREIDSRSNAWLPIILMVTALFGLLTWRARRKE